MTMHNHQTKSISTCIIGQPNAGKSTLLNRIIGEKLSIVTPKVQTTRSIITGIVTIDDTQLIIFDTPGIFKTKNQLDRAMVRSAWSNISQVDVVIIIIDSTRQFDNMMADIIKKVRMVVVGKKIIVLMNKIDIYSNNYISNLLSIEQLIPLAKIFNISALDGKGIQDLITYLQQNAKVANWVYDKDAITNLPARFLACEITREQLFLQLHQELPYHLNVECESWQEQADGSVKINQLIVVSKDSYKNMIIGKKGHRISHIGAQARINIAELLGCKVHLFLFVKVDPNVIDKITV